MLRSDVTHVAVLTPEGRAAIATVEVRGPRAFDTVAKLFQPAAGAPLDSRPPSDLAGRLHYGRWIAATGEETICCVVNPESVEIHCHGGVAAARAIVNSLVDAGCQPTSWDALLALTDSDPIRRAARRALARATTQRTAAILLDQFAGALRRQIEAALDAIQSKNLLEAENVITSLLESAHLGRHLVEPFRVALLGTPNAGKSSLMNAIMGYQRAIVHETSGTTRDAVTATTAFDGWPVELVDTAGMHPATDPVELAGIARAREIAQTANLVLLVVDRSIEPNAIETKLHREWPRALVVYTKCDLPAAHGRSDRCAESVTSAVTNQGMSALLTKIVDRLVGSQPAPGAAVVFTDAQAASLRAAARRLQSPDAPAAAQILAELIASNT